MAFHEAILALKSANAGINSTMSLTQLPTSILETFIPGYSLIRSFVMAMLGFDITMFVSVTLLAAGLGALLIYSGDYLSWKVQYHCMSSVEIESGEYLYDYIMDWIGGKNIFEKSPKIIAKDGNLATWDMAGDDAANVEMDCSRLLNFRNWNAKVPLQFHPSFRRHYFFHKDRFFLFSRWRVEEADIYGRRLETLILRCLGRSTQPIKDLMEEAREYSLNRKKASTFVYRPASSPKDGASGFWLRAAERSNRPMGTVILDDDQKTRVLADMNEYLHPFTSNWYADRGIPYRRGYLFSGPPGTGKTSFVWAIAGAFGLNVYCISLSDPSLSEEALERLFNKLPRRCIVLLEDVDAAGLKKRQKPREDNEPDLGDSTAQVGAEITKAIKAAKDTDSGGKGITLSGLLNAIDGVASHEGRILVMTTNCPEKLDEALVRPGRIDMKIAFTNATRPQTREIFARMYAPYTPSGANQKQDDPGLPSPILIDQRNTVPRVEASNNDETLFRSADHGAKASIHKTPEISSYQENVEKMATEFADRLPEDVFTPAQIQGFLLTRKTEPERAVKEIEAWKDAEIRAKDGKKSSK